MEQHSIKQANEYAALVFERMKVEVLAPTPQNYELWYAYYAKTHPEIRRAIDILDANDQAITQEHCAEIHERFLSANRQSDQVKAAGDKIQETIKDVNEMVHNVQEATTQYNTELTEVTGQLQEGEVDKAQLEKIVQTVASNTENMMAQNAALEAKLAQSSEAMLDMQRDLELARKEALTDGLTNLANRKAFDSEMDRILRETEEGQLTFSVIMMDIDHFKSFNDNFGHQVGDQVLKLVARTIKDGVKGRDVAARYGGEEFAVILPETNIEGALQVGDSLRKAVASKDIVNRNTGEKIARITLSGGCAEYIRGETIEQMIERADSALYTAKHNGRNQISAASSTNKKKAS